MKGKVSDFLSVWWSLMMIMNTNSALGCLTFSFCLWERISHRYSDSKSFVSKNSKSKVERVTEGSERELIKKQCFTNGGNQENDVACFHWLAWNCHQIQISIKRTIEVLSQNRLCDLSLTMIEKHHQFKYQINLSNVWLPIKYDFFYKIFISGIPLISQQPK